MHTESPKTPLCATCKATQTKAECVAYSCRSIDSVFPKKTAKRTIGFAHFFECAHIDVLCAVTFKAVCSVKEAVKRHKSAERVFGIGAVKGECLSHGVCRISPPLVLVRWGRFMLCCLCLVVQGRCCLVFAEFLFRLLLVCLYESNGFVAFHGVAGEA